MNIKDYNIENKLIEDLVIVYDKHKDILLNTVVRSTIFKAFILEMLNKDASDEDKQRVKSYFDGGDPIIESSSSTQYLTRDNTAFSTEEWDKNNQGCLGCDDDDKPQFLEKKNPKSHHPELDEIETPTPIKSTKLTREKRRLKYNKSDITSAHDYEDFLWLLGFDNKKLTDTVRLNTINNHARVFDEVFVGKIKLKTSARSAAKMLWEKIQSHK